MGIGTEHRLKIGVVKFPAETRPGALPVPAFINDPSAPTSNEIFMALNNLLKLRLIHPKNANDKDTDSLMRVIAQKGDEEMDEKNFITKANSNFAHNFVEILSFNITYNQFFYYSKWPKNCSKPSKKASEAIRHNAKIIHHYLFGRDEKVTKLLFPHGTKNIATNPSAILGVRNVIIQKAMHAIRFGYEGFPTKSLWVHQLFLLSTIHPRLNLNVEPKLVEILDRMAPEWKKFLAVKTEAGRKMFFWKGSQG